MPKDRFLVNKARDRVNASNAREREATGRDTLKMSWLESNRHCREVVFDLVALLEVADVERWGGALKRYRNMLDWLNGDHYRKMAPETEARAMSLTRILKRIASGELKPEEIVTRAPMIPRTARRPPQGASLPGWLSGKAPPTLVRPPKHSTDK